MKKTLLSILALAIAFITFQSHADDAVWERVLNHPATLKVFKTSDGTLLMSDFPDDPDVPNNGGIYYSTDKGVTWTKTKVRGYNFDTFVEGGGYVFATATGCRIGRSADNGKTWEILSYRSVIEPISDPKGIDYDVSYGMNYIGNRLYVSSFNTGAVLYSEDFGDTWNLTDYESLMINVGGQLTSDYCYNIVDFNGTPIFCGMYALHYYDADNDKWTSFRSSNFLGVIAKKDSVYYCARAMDHQNLPFIETTTDFSTWDSIPPTPFTYNRNIRCMNVDSLGGIFVGMPLTGVAFTPDKGESWYMFDNDPGKYPCAITFDNEYVYVAVYDFVGGSKSTGIWRMKLDSLKNMYESGINAIINDGISGYTFDGNTLRVDNGGDASLTISDMAGRSQKLTLSEGAVSLDGLAPGVYVFVARTASGVVTGKITKTN